MLDWALWYARQGFEVFPVHRIKENGMCSCGDPQCSSPGKHPLISNGVRGANANELSVKDRWGLHRHANIGIHTRNVNVLDVDGPEGLAELNRLLYEHDKDGVVSSAPSVRTGGGGLHLFFRAAPQRPSRNRARFLPGLDWRAEGGYVVAAPSIHHSGKRYTWERCLTEYELPRVPGWLMNLLHRRSNINVLPSEDRDGIRKIEIEALATIKKGTRNDSLMSLCGRLFWEGRSSDEVWTVLSTINQTLCKPPYPEKSLRRIFEWTREREEMKRRTA